MKDDELVLFPHGLLAGLMVGVVLRFELPLHSGR